MVARSPMLLGGLSTCAVAPASDAVEGTTTALDPVRGPVRVSSFSMAASPSSSRATAAGWL